MRLKWPCNLYYKVNHLANMFQEKKASDAIRIIFNNKRIKEILTQRYQNVTVILI